MRMAKAEERALDLFRPRSRPEWARYDKATRFLPTMRPRDEQHPGCADADNPTGRANKYFGSEERAASPQSAPCKPRPLGECSGSCRKGPPDSPGRCFPGA